MSRWNGSLVALLAVAAAAGLRFWLHDLLRGQPFVTFFLAVVLVAFVAGPGAALLATLLSAAAGVFFFMEPWGAVEALSRDDLLRLAAFTTISLVVVAFTRSKSRAVQSSIDVKVAAAEAQNRAAAAAEIRNREEFLRGVLDSLPHEIAVIDASGAILSINRRWKCFARANNGSIAAGANYLAASRAAADEGDPFAQRALAGLESLLTGEREQFSMEYPCHSPDRETWFLMHAARANCAPAAVVISHTDITERVQADRSRAELMEKLRDSDRRKDEFLATLAHELRNPLAPICNALHVLREDAAQTKLDPRDAAALEIAERQARHLTRLVDDLLEVSRITRGKIELRKQRIDLATVLRNALDMARPAIERAGHRLDVALPKEPITIDGDPVRLAQLFANLLNNAAKYTDPGGTIALAAGVLNGAAEIVVRDNGVGIPADMLPHVFDLFTQVDRTLGRAQGGIGVGLSLVRRIAELHGGGAEARSEGLGKGSAFTIRLPVAGADADAADAATEATTARAGDLPPLDLLVIDDDRDVADSLAALLESFGHRVRVAYGGRDGLAALGDVRPDLIFLDLGMPGLDGYETARQIRARPEGRDVTLVALTGWGPEQIQRRAREAGFDRELTKPASLPELRDALAAASDRAAKKSRANGV